MPRYASFIIGLSASLAVSFSFLYKTEWFERRFIGEEPLSAVKEVEQKLTGDLPATSSPPLSREPSDDSAPSSGPQQKKAPVVKPPEQVRQIRLSAPPLPRIELPPPAPVPAATSSPAAAVPAPVPEPPAPPLPPPLPPLDELSLLAAVVKIECPSEDGRGKYVGSGFVLPKGIVVTAAHVIKDSGSDTCEVIFPNKDRAPSHFLRGITEDLAEVKKRHDEEGIDVAVIFLPALSAYPEGAAVFPRGYPFIPYPICDEPQMLKDKLLHFGYPSNYLNQSYLSKLDGEAVAYADIQGIKEQLSEDQTFTFKTPIFGYTNDQSRLHPYMVSRVPSFYGDSGGLAFNRDKQCILGPHRGGTIGGGAGENFSVFPVLGWQGALKIIPR